MMTNERRRCEVLVLGGGPAGASAALRLSRMGHDVLLVEAAEFPRWRIGESITPAIFPLLDVLGVRQAIESAGFLTPARAIVRWTSHEVVNVGHGEHGLLVDRGRFDAILLDAARRAGVAVIQPGRAGRPLRVDGGWRVPVMRSGESVTLECKFLVDATGRRSPLPGRWTRLSAPLLAIHAYWRGAPEMGEVVRIETSDAWWYWAAPLPDGTYNATVFVDPRMHRQELQGGLTACYRRLLAASRLLRGVLAGELAAPPRACDATARISSQLAARDMIRVGEAAFSIDPLSSQGVRAALLSSIQAAVAVHTLLTEPMSAELAVSFYAQRQRATADRQADEAARWYGEKLQQTDTPFWRDRGAPRPDDERAAAERSPPAARTALVLGPRASLHDCAVLEGDLVRQRRALCHPSIAEPVAFVGGAPLAELLAKLEGGRTVGELMAAWTPALGSARAGQLLSWLWQRDIVVARPT